MKKILSICFLFLFTIKLFAQLDTEHWFAPMIDRTTNSDPYQTLYFSTNEAIPFSVDIYNNNVVIGTVTISKGNPVKFSVPREYIITKRSIDTFTPNTLGLHTKGSKAYFVNLRFSVTNHAEIITSKGLAGLGTKFYAAMAPITAENSILNFMAGIIATEDNTKVVVSGYKSDVKFSTPQKDSIKFELNKGESYLIDGSGNQSFPNGFIGAKIEANKPIAVTNGNFNGQYASNTRSSSDILMDESVPVDRLGDEFALIKGNGNIGSGMETALIVATEDDTEVYVNDASTPIAKLSQGEYFLVPDSKYILQRNSHYNLYIKTTKKVYVYQLLAGDAGDSEIATGGFNYIPPLSCYLPKTIDEIGFIDENFVVSNNHPSGILNIPTKLNIITERGATVKINGVEITNPAEGPFNLTGNNDWVTYSRAHVSGNISISSTKAVTAGIAAGDGAVGYGGYFAGFSSIPSIIKIEGDCVPGIKLSASADFGTYQWNLNNIPIVGAQSKTFMPTSAGNYTLTVTQDICPPITTAAVKILNCIVASEIQKEICGSYSLIPKFSVSKQTIDLKSIKITNLPSKGSVSINPTTGEVTYTANVGATGPDNFKISFAGADPFPDTELINVNLMLDYLVVKDETLISCENGGTGNFDLTSAQLTNNNPVIISYYKTLASAQSENIADKITNQTAYNSAPDKIFAVVKSPAGCKEIATITLQLLPSVELNTTLFTSTFCDDDFDGKYQVSFSSVTPIILKNSNNFSINYFETEANAQSNSNPLPNNYIFTGNIKVFVRAQYGNCLPAIQALNLTTKPVLVLEKSKVNFEICDEDLDATKTVNLSDYKVLFTSDSSVQTSYFATLDDAKKNRNPLANTFTLTRQNTFYLRFSTASTCDAIGELNVKINIPKKSAILTDKNICPNTTTVLDAGAGFISYQWSSGDNSASISAGVGTYFVDLTSANGCVYRQTVTVKAVELPTISAVDIKESTVTITVKDGNSPYYFSLNGSPFQTSNVFYNVKSGENTIRVQSAELCTPVTKKIAVIKLNNSITPNNDGKNDRIDYSGLLTKDQPKLLIYDRYGKLIFTGSKDNRFIWDGKLENRNLPTGTYWYVMEWQEFGINTVLKYSGWLLLKNSNFSN